jgi:6-pyruvoyl-tetrahydropterin synthase
MRLAMFALLACLLLTGQAWSVDIHALLEAAARHPGVEISRIAVQESTLQQEAATAALFPKFNLFSTTEVYNSPTNVRPMPPTEVNVQRGDTIPFSREILRYGLTFELPLYVKPLYVLKEKALSLTEKAKLDRRLTLISREAAVVSLNSSFEYLRSLEKAIGARKESLAKARDDMTLKVQNGRAAEAELLKINNSINDLDQQQNEIRTKVLDVIQGIKTATDITLYDPAPMEWVGEIRPGPLLGMQKQEKEVEAAAKELERRQAARYPTLGIFATVSGNDGVAYNNDRHFFRTYDFVGLALRFPLFDKSLLTDEAIARVQWQKAQTRLEETRIELQALADNLRERLPVIDRSITIAEESVENSEALLAIAKVAFDLGRMITEEYLRFESQRLAAEATLYQARQQRWQILAQQAVLYGIDLRGLVR